jgi:hypothetical protein
MKIRTQVAIALVIPSLVVIAAGLNYSGLCIRKWSYLSDAEALESALRRQAREMEGMPKSPSSGDLSAYLAAHPHCCVVLGDVNILNDTFIDYITGFRKKWVRLLYKSNSATVPNYRDAIVAVLPCGDAVYDSDNLISEDQMNSRLQEIGRKISAVPYKIHTVLTDNGIQFTFPPRYADGPTARYVTHMFDMRCRENGIEHRLTKIKHPWTNGQANA